MTITRPRRRTRRTHSEAFKQSLIEACGEPTASAAGVALANGINANQLRRWMREKLVNHYEFYAAFTSDDEFRLLCEGKTLGSLPVSHPLLPDQRVIFAGRRWRVLDVDAEKKVIGKPPAIPS